MKVILQDALPEAQAGDSRLPGTMPCDPNDWLRVDEAYPDQMAYRTALLDARPDEVLYENLTAGQEVLREALRVISQLGFEVRGAQVTCPDGRLIALDWDAPLRTLGHLVQEDICVLQKRDDEHVLTGAVLCFPASWRLSDKINQPLTTIHVPVESYDPNVARRVQRLFDGVQAGKPMWRFNKLRYANADLHQPDRKRVDGEMPYIRSERQCILRLPQTDAVVFTIHTHVIHA